MIYHGLRSQYIISIYIFFAIETYNLYVLILYISDYNKIVPPKKDLKWPVLFNTNFYVKYFIFKFYFYLNFFLYYIYFLNIIIKYRIISFNMMLTCR